MRLILVRHGQTEGNQEKIFDHDDAPLTPLGHEQAHRAAEALRDENITVAYVSPLRRARETAEHILRHHPHTTTVIEASIVELNPGILKGKPHAALSELQQASGAHTHEFKAPNGESKNEVIARTKRWFETIRVAHQGETVLAVTHGGALVRLLLQALNYPEDRVQEVRHWNTGITILSVPREGPVQLEQLNSLAHVDTEMHTR